MLQHCHLQWTFSPSRPGTALDGVPSPAPPALRASPWRAAAPQRRCQVHRAPQPALPVLRWQLLQACAGHCADERNRSAATQRKVTRHGQLTGLELRSEIGDVTTHHKLRIDKTWSNRPQKCKKFARRSSSLALSSQ